jgi:glycosyltransferase involved in cell wall biosynthesis
LRIAVVHDWLVVNGGAEKVLKAILEIYPESDIFTLVDFLNAEEREEILNGKGSTTSFIQKLPLAQKHFRNYLPLFPMGIESLNLGEYDLILSSSWAVAKGVKKGEKQIHICYSHTPIRYAWDLYGEYTSSLKQPKKFLVQWALKYIRNWDLKTVDRVDHFIANSNFVKVRIERTYNRNATVIYPPVDVERFTLHTEKGEFYLTASRLVPYKKTKLIVEAFNNMPNRKLVVIGAGEELDSIRGIAKSNIELLGYQPDNVLKSYMQRAKGFIYGAVEDFGIVPIEAMACGTPVIALNRGGTAETVIDGFNGVHFERQSVSDILDAIDKFEKLEFNYREISNYAKSFSIERFKAEFQVFVKTRQNYPQSLF